MDDLNQLRRKIDVLDSKIMTLLEERFDISVKVGNYKKLNNTPILNTNRETEILNKISKLSFKKEIKAVYETLLSESKSLQ